MSISGCTSRTGRISTWLPGRNATAPLRSTVKPPLTRPKITPSTRLPAANSSSSLSQAASRRARSRDSIASPWLFSTRSTNTSTSSPTWSSAFWPGAGANSRSGTRPSDLRPTSITTMSFSMAVTVPLTTRPSKPWSSPPSVSFKSAAKSSRVGNAAVAISWECPSIIVPAVRLSPEVFSRTAARTEYPGSTQGQRRAEGLAHNAKRARQRCGLSRPLRAILREHRSQDDCHIAPPKGGGKRASDRNKRLVASICRPDRPLGRRRDGGRDWGGCRRPAADDRRSGAGDRRRGATKDA